MNNYRDLTGLRFGRWLVIDRAPNRGKALMWNCVCDCGTHKEVHGTSLKTGTSTNCGCGRRERHRSTHGLTHHPLYRVWQRMKGATSSPTHQDYKHYGARGISICEEWYHSFITFYEWAMSHGFSVGLEIDRIDTNGDYEPENCRFVDRSAQMRNTRRTHNLTFDGKTQSIMAWAEELGIKPTTLYNRICTLGWCPEKALTTEVYHGNHRGRH